MIYIVFFLMMLVFLGLMILLYVIVSLKMEKDLEMNSSYECGFEMMSLVRSFFSYRFFLISILFLIFDVEISLLLPVPYLKLSFVSSWFFVFFLWTLFVGLIYEYNYGSLDWL